MEIKDGFVRMYHKKNKVWAELDHDGVSLAEANGKVKIKYQLNQPHEYLVPAKALRNLDYGPNIDTKTAPKKTTLLANKPQSHPRVVIAPDNAEFPQNAIILFTDGASSGNPGPAGIGVYLQFGEHEKEISEYIGISTNNIAELKAVERGLLAIKNKKLPVKVLTDSQYVLGLLTQNWKAQKNQEIVTGLKKLLQEFSDIELIKVKGHYGNRGNEKADQLAVAAIKKAAK